MIKLWERRVMKAASMAAMVGMGVFLMLGRAAMGADGAGELNEDGSGAAITAKAAAASTSTVGEGKVVGLDEFFNHQVKNGVPFHYIWEDTAASGYSRFGKVWTDLGAKIVKVDHSPRAEDLAKLSIYIICDPNTPAKAAGGKPNYIDAGAIDAIDAWVKAGGVLLLFANDKNNCEFEHLNQLSRRFGITFNDDLRNTVPKKTQMIRGVFTPKDFPDHPIFAGVKMIYMKEICTLETTAPAAPLVISDKQDGATGKDIIMATSQYGKGLVFAVGDPWVYNEYIDVKTAMLDIENRKAAVNLANWALGESGVPRIEGGK